MVFKTNSVKYNMILTQPNSPVNSHSPDFTLQRNLKKK